jgi:hypothetical protein
VVYSLSSLLAIVYNIVCSVLSSEIYTAREGAAKILCHYSEGLLVKMLLIFLLLIYASQAKDEILHNLIDLSASDWYYIKLTSDEPDHSCQGKENPISDILENLSTKLSVPDSSFLITSLDTLSIGIISTNLTLFHPLPGLHISLSNLQLSSPVFNICGQQFSLALLLHQNTHRVGEDERQEVSEIEFECLNLDLV